MTNITVYSKPDCVQCTSTYRALDSNGLKYKVVDLTEDSAAFEFVRSLGYQRAPVIVTDNEHWSGFRPDKIEQISQTITEDGTALEITDSYSSGWRLEPKLWSQSTPDDYGRVNFNNADGESVFTAWVQRTEAGYVLRVDEHSDNPLVIETSTVRNERQRASSVLVEAAENLARELDSVSLEFEDPDSFGGGHIVLYPAIDFERRFAITERYDTDWADEDRTPTGWEWVDERRTLTDDGMHWVELKSGVSSTAQVGAVIGEMKKWTADRQVEHIQAQIAPTLPVTPVGQPALSAPKCAM